MNSTMITSKTQTPFYISKLNLPNQKSFLDSSTHLKFHTNFTKSNFPNSKSIKTTQIRAAAASTAIPETVNYVNTESTFYELLGISETVTLSEIKKAYKQLARKYHPDVSPPEKTEEYTKRFLQVQEAYETLSDPQTRALYDIDMKNGLHTIFTARKRSIHQEFDDMSEWENRWQSQLSELIRKSNCQDSENMSWGARMRSRRNCSN